LIKDFAHFDTLEMVERLAPYAEAKSDLEEELRAASAKPQKKK
jgi:hypothetical protein